MIKVIIRSYLGRKGLFYFICIGKIVFYEGEVRVRIYFRYIDLGVEVEYVEMLFIRFFLI